MYTHERPQKSLRVALFTDSYHEANGVATVSRQLAHFAGQQGLPFLVVHGSSKGSIVQQDSLTIIALKRSFAAFRLDKELLCDPLLVRHKKFITEQLMAFKPDLIHITGPGDLGILGFWAAHSMGIPLVASWHTNLHEYISRRLEKVLNHAPSGVRKMVSHSAERESLRACMRFYRMARFLLAPNWSMVDLLHERTHRPAFLMSHGVDLDRYTPVERVSKGGDLATARPFRIGYVGRLTAEKNVRAFAVLHRDLQAAGKANVEFLLVGEGGERNWLERHIPGVQLPGVLRGGALASAFASMDLLVFPSRTDTFGLVVLEAMASGVPVVTTPETGARVGIQHGVNGFISDDFTRDVLLGMQSEARRQEMGVQARRFAESRSWCGVFEQLYETYAEGLALEDHRAPAPWGRYFQHSGF